MKQLIKHSLLNLLVFSIFANINTNGMHKYRRSKQTRRMHRRIPKKVPQRKVNRRFLRKQRRQQRKNTIEKKWRRAVASLFPRKKLRRSRSKPQRTRSSDTVASHSRVSISAHSSLLSKIILMFAFIFTTTFAYHDFCASGPEGICTPITLPDCDILETRLINEESNPTLRDLYNEVGIVDEFCEKKMSPLKVQGSVHSEFRFYSAMLEQIEHPVVEDTLSEIDLLLRKHFRQRWPMLLKQLEQMEHSVIKDKLERVKLFLRLQMDTTVVRKILEDNPDAIEMLRLREATPDIYDRILLEKYNLSCNSWVCK